MKKSQSPKRWNWLAELANSNHFVTGAEVGVATGITTFYLMENCPQLRLLHAVDIWKPMPGSGWDGIDMMKVFTERKRLYPTRIKVHYGLSWEMADKVDNTTLDFVFIDADHDYDSVKKDIRAWLPTLKPDGVLCGHDHHFEGVVKALKELVPNYKLAGIDNCWYCKRSEI